MDISTLPSIPKIRTRHQPPFTITVPENPATAGEESSVADDGHHLHLDSIESPAIVASNQDLCEIVPFALIHRANLWWVET
jgi:hypothetical protein